MRMRHFTGTLLRATALLLAGGLAAAAPQPPQQTAEPAGGLALYGPQDLKYRDWAAHGGHFDYANPDAPKGGNITLGALGGATKLNPFSLKGAPVPYLSSLVFETLMTNSLDPDEPFSMYGVLAEKAAIAPDRLSVTYWINPQARWSDGEPVTADDVLFTFGLFHDPGFAPFYANYYEHVARVEKLDRLTVRFVLKSATNQELPLITGQMPVLPKHVYGVPGKNFGEDFQFTAVGSGPYRVKAFTRELNTELVLERNPDWWGRDLPVNRGCYNFDTITFRFYQDLDRLKSVIKGTNPDARIDVLTGVKAQDWATEFGNAQVRNGWLVKREFPHQRLSDMTCHMFNLRRPLFQDIRIRKAVAAMLDFDWMNRNLYFMAYTRQISCWDNLPEMTSRGPAEGRIRDWLVALNKKYGDACVPPDAWLRGPYNMDTGADGKPMPVADRIAATAARLDAIGWKYDPEAGVRMKDGQELSFEIILYDPGYLPYVTPFVENLQKAGIRAIPRVVQQAEYEKKLREFDFDMIITYLAPSDSPGNELIDNFHSSCANTPGSWNLMGLQNPAVDEAINRILHSRARVDLVDNTKALDRILCANHYFIPDWYVPADRMVFWNRFGYPAKMTTRLSVPDLTVLMFWWVDKERDAALRRAMAEKKPIDPAPPPQPTAPQAAP